jgi:hypothetical protein
VTIQLVIGVRFVNKITFSCIIPFLNIEYILSNNMYKIIIYKNCYYFSLLFSCFGWYVKFILINNNT